MNVGGHQNLPPCPEEESRTPGIVHKTLGKNDVQKTMPSRVSQKPFLQPLRPLLLMVMAGSAGQGV